MRPARRMMSPNYPVPDEDTLLYFDVFTTSGLRLHRRVCPVRLGFMFTTSAHTMMVMMMPSPGHFAMPRDGRGQAETGRLR